MYVCGIIEKNSNISPCKPYSKWVLVNSLGLSSQTLFGIEPNRCNLSSEREQIFSLLHPGGEIRERILCLVLGPEPQQPVGQLDQRLLRELHVREHPTMCYRNLNGSRREGGRSRRGMKWAGMHLWKHPRGRAGVKEGELALHSPTFPVAP